MSLASEIEVRIVGDEWQTPLKAQRQPSGWLHYELRDSTNGLAQPQNWRYKIKMEFTQQERLLIGVVKRSHVGRSAILKLLKELTSILSPEWGEDTTQLRDRISSALQVIHDFSELFS